MFDPFASTNPATTINQNPPKAVSTDVFGGVPDIFSDMAATAFQPIDPETGRPTEHTPETLDPFLRDENRKVISSESVANFGDDVGVSPSIDETIVDEPVEEQTLSSSIPQDDAFLAPPSPAYESPMPEETVVAQETISSVDQVDTDNSEETTSYFETIPSFAIAEEPVLQVSEEQPEEIGLIDETASVDPVSDTETTQMSNHYDPFVDTISNISVESPVAVDDPFLVDVALEEEILPVHEEVVEQDPFLENPVDNGLQDIPDEQASSTIQDQSDNTDQPIVAIEEESPVQDVVVPELEPVDPFLLDHDAVDVSLASEISVDTSMPTEAIPADDESPAVDLEPIVSENSDENQQSQDIPTAPETSVVVEDEQVADETPIVAPQEVAVSSEEALSSHETVASLQEQSDAVSVSEPEGPSMLQGLVEGMLDPFSSTSSVKDDGLEVAPIEEESSPEAIVADEEMQETNPAIVEQVAPAVASIIENEEVIDEDKEDQNSVSEPTVNEDEQDMQKSGLSDVFVKFQELLGSIYRVHDSRGGHDLFTVVGADNDALYITYSFVIEASAEQAIVITKESTDRKDGDTIDTHVLRFAINRDFLVEVYVDGVLVFVEDQLVDNVKAKMQLMDKFNKFIFLIDQFIQDSANQVSGDAIVSAQEEFGGF